MGMRIPIPTLIVHGTTIEQTRPDPVVLLDGTNTYSTTNYPIRGYQHATVKSRIESGTGIL